MVSNGATQGHGLLHRMDLQVEFLFCLFVPRHLVQVVMTVAKQGVRRCPAGGDLDQPCIGQHLESVGVVGSFGDFACFLLHGNEFTIDDDDLVGSPSQTARIVHQQLGVLFVVGVGDFIGHLEIVFDRYPLRFLVVVC